MAISLQGPIPGQSLTREVGGAPFEQPPLYSNNEKALAWHLDRLSKENHLEDLMFLLDQGFPVQTFVESLLTKGVMEGYHTVDTSMLIGPTIHQYIKEMADSAGIKYTEWDEPSQEQKDKEKFKQRFQVVLANKQNRQPEVASPTEIAPVENPPKGLISRRK